jgi:hypothetical protein
MEWTPRQFQLDVLERPYDFRSPFAGEQFVVLLWVVDPAVTRDEQWRLSVQLVTQGCRYAVCAGHGCSTWDDSIDWAYLESDPNFNPPDERFVMTTWHEDQSVEEVAEFFAEHTSFADFVAKNYLVLLVGTDAQLEFQIAGEVGRSLAEASDPEGW